MTRAWRNSIIIAVVLVGMVAPVTSALAGGRKRIVVLDLEGPKADKFHDDIVEIIKKKNIVVPTAKWNSTAEFLDAGAVNEKNFQKIAKKLKVDGIVQGKIEKRRDEYIIRLKLRAGTSGEVVGNGVDTKAEGPRIDGKSSKDIKDELLGQIDALDGNHEAGGATPSKDEDDDDDSATTAKKTPAPAAKKEDPKKKVAAKKDADDDDDDAKPAAKKTPAPAAKKEDPKKKVAAKKDADDDDDDAKPAAKKTPAPAAKKEDPKKKVAAKKDADDDDDDAKPAAKKTAAKDDAKSDDDDDSAKKKGSDDDDGGSKKKVASAEDDDGSVTKSAEPKAGVTAAQLAPATRGVDIVVGLSLMERKFSFTSNLDAMVKPPGYHQAAPVPGAYVDATLYPLGLSHGGGALANVGLGFTLDKVLGLQSQITNPDGTVAKQPTTEQRYAINLSYRIPFASGGMAAIVVGYGGQHFSITHGAATVDIPDVNYTGVSPQVLLRYPIGAKMYFDLDGGAMLLTNAGEIQSNDQYGQATVLGVTADAGIDYMITKAVFARVTLRFETVGLSFKGSGTMSTSRDGDPMTQDVTAARDNYFGGALTVGYAY